MIKLFNLKLEENNSIGFETEIYREQDFLETRDNRNEVETKMQIQIKQSFTNTRKKVLSLKIFKLSGNTNRIKYTYLCFKVFLFSSMVSLWT